MNSTFAIPLGTRIAEQVPVSPRAPSPNPSTSPTVPVATRPLASQSLSISVRTDIYGGQEFGVINLLAVSETTPSVSMP